MAHEADNATGGAEIVLVIARRAKRAPWFPKDRKGGWSSGKMSVEILVANGRKSDRV